MKTDFERKQDGALEDGELEVVCGGGVFDNLRAVAKTIKEAMDHLTEPFRKGKDAD